MPGMGPPPKHPSQRRRTNATVPMIELPAEGRKGPAPAWPLPPSPRVTKTMERHEADLWEELWALPQAVQWERAGWTREVAQYTRFKARAEMGDIHAAREARQWSDRLGLSPLAMLRLRWEVVADEVAEKRDERGAASVRRLRAVDKSA